MKSEQNEPPENSLIYYTCGTESWHKTSQWPPEGIQSQKLYFAPERRLVHHQPDGEGEDVFAVDFRASSGRYNRWWELGVAERRSVTYGDRSLQNDHVLAYQSDPLEHDWEITGSPVLSLYVDSSEPDCSFFAYLEDVFPDGKIVCIGEGLLRAIHRKILPSPSVFYEDLPYHSFRQADAMPLKPGEIGEVTFALLPMSVLIRRGHRLRITIAGHDQGNFERVPAVGQPIWKIQRSRQYPSRIQLPGKFR